MINIEMVRLGALEEHYLPCIKRVVEQSADVHNMWSDSLGMRQQVFGHLVWIDGAAVVNLDQQVILLLQRRLHLPAQDRLVEKVLDADTDPVDLVGVRRADSASRGADPGLA